MSSIKHIMCDLSTLSSHAPNTGYCVWGCEDSEELEKAEGVADGLV